MGIIFDVCPILPMEQSLTLFDKRSCLGNSLVRPDGKMLEAFSSSELEDAHPKVLDAALSPFLEEIAFHSKFTGKFLLKKSGLTDEFWHNNITLPSENALDDYLIFLAKNGRCEIRKPNKNDLAYIRAFSVATQDRQHNWSYLKRVESASLSNENFEIEAEAKDAQREKAWSTFLQERREAEAAQIEKAQREEADILRHEVWLEADARAAASNIPANEVLLHSDEQPAAPQGTIGWLKNKVCGVYSWCAENPKEAIVLGIGTGVLSWLVYKNYIGENANPVQHVIESVQQQVIQPVQQVIQPVQQVIQPMHAPKRVYVPYYARAGMGLSNGLGNLR